MSFENDECALLSRLRDTPRIFEEIAASSAAELKNQKRLRSQFDDSLVRAALVVHEARDRARGLLPDVEHIWLSRVGLEQATCVPVARHKAARFSGAGQVYDLCSGIGVDTAALASTTRVTAMDIDPAMCLRCEWNSAQWQPDGIVSVVCEDVTRPEFSGRYVHVDPDRRAGSDRPVRRLEQYQPGLEWMQNLTSTAAGGAIKLGPASNFMQKFPGCEIELISVDGECREATVWFGELAGPYPFRATALSTRVAGGVSSPMYAAHAETVSAEPLSAWSRQAEKIGDWIYDPDPAIVRSGLLDVVAEQLGLERMDSEEEYLTSDRQVSSAFTRAFRVEAILSNSEKELRAWLRNDPSCYYEIKCRRIPVTAAAVQRQLPTGDAAPRVILFARFGGAARIIVARREPLTE